MKNRHIKKTNVAALACASLLGSAAVSQAAVVIGDIISVNLSSTSTSNVPTGAAVIGQSGDTWTNILNTGGFASSVSGTYALNTTTGASSGVSMTFAGGRVHGEASTTNLDVFESGFYLDPVDTSATITFSGFTAGTIVDLYLYASAGHTVGEGATFTFNSIAQTTAATQNAETSYVLGDNYVKYSGLVADGSGNITGTWTRPSSYSVFNGAQIAVIPEPSAALLGGLGMLALLRRRR